MDAAKIAQVFKGLPPPATYCFGCFRDLSFSLERIIQRDLRQKGVAGQRSGDGPRGIGSNYSGSISNSNNNGFRKCSSTSGGSDSKGGKGVASSAAAAAGVAVGESQLVLICEDCGELFCVECDLYVHESLHNCPGCELRGKAIDRSSTGEISGK
eukprot:CAMPEP_0175067196 /NCGR_PEP_ID=MMETSP0052_2-20121109/16954_1 /TAXON_ID=51329 ORGANISM="Polytomella parva, Strain SAG 63-3" /NCGR_SAMPLE_ID=MMETSP0052_2 /ASSEMBLY_ACC=CAM_ASM_000194 /LENGTH=154 /DNA_ID=CAMNT_0016334031 /DNA_START=27 /DNA_END=491 /DNA_ORIENTATION=+